MNAAAAAGDRLLVLVLLLQLDRAPLVGDVEPDLGRRGRRGTAACGVGWGHRRPRLMHEIIRELSDEVLEPGLVVEVL